MKRYTIAEFKKHTRDILNEVRNEPVLITRYDETFMLSIANDKMQTITKNPSVGVSIIDPEVLKKTQGLMIVDKKGKLVEPERYEPMEPTA